MARRRDCKLSSIALGTALLAMGAPLAAQTAPATGNTATPAPSPTDNSLIGPPQLRDFTLNGTVTQPAEPVTETTTSTPAPTPPAQGAGSTAPTRAAPAPTTTPAARTSRPATIVAAPDQKASAESVTVSLPPPTPAESPSIEPGVGEETIASTSPIAAPAEDGSRWPWILAAIVAALGAGFFLWRRRQAGAGRYAHAGTGELVAAPEPTPAPPPLPRAPTPQPRVPAPQPRAQAPHAPPPPAPAPIPGGIVASGLKPKLSFELRPIRAETDAARGGSLLFDVIVTNNGSAPARDVLVEAQLINAGPQQDEQISRFFREPVGSGERLPVIPPMGKISIKTRLTISGEQMHPIAVEGRELFVPLVAFNALYRWSGGEAQDSASFLVGRAKDEGSKMAPFRLDLGARGWTGLGARPHSMGLQQ